MYVEKEEEQKRFFENFFSLYYKTLSTFYFSTEKIYPLVANSSGLVLKKQSCNLAIYSASINLHIIQF